jgi:predicted aldo/keto reductase-like oxidoreductase
VNYIDTAPNYNDSEVRLGRALRGRRDKVFLTSKIETRTKEEALGQIRESLRRLQTDHLDCVLFHNIGRDDRFPDLDAALSSIGGLGGLLEAKKQGMIRHIGCSTHSAPARVIRAFDTGEFEILMCPLNFVSVHTYALETKLLPEARKRNIAVIAMKVLGGPMNRTGARLTSPEDYAATMRYAWSVPGVVASVIGVRNADQLHMALNAARSFKPLSAAESAALSKRGKALAAEWGPAFGAVS